MDEQNQSHHSVQYIFISSKNKKTHCSPTYVSLEFIVKTIQKFRKKPWKLNSLCSVHFSQLHVDTMQTQQYKRTLLCMHDLCICTSSLIEQFLETLNLCSMQHSNSQTVPLIHCIVTYVPALLCLFSSGCNIGQFIILLCNAVIFQNPEYQVVILICDSNLQT